MLRCLVEKSLAFFFVYLFVSAFFSVLIFFCLFFFVFSFFLKHKIQDIWGCVCVCEHFVFVCLFIFPNKYFDLNGLTQLCPYQC